MKKYKHLSALLLILIFMPVLMLNVYANSSWVWISETRPYDILPFVIVITLVIEISFIYFIGIIIKNKRRWHSGAADIGLHRRFAGLGSW